MKNRMRKSITYKIFIITSILLILSSIFTYLLIYTLLPSFYYDYKKSSLDNGFNELIITVSKLDLNDAVSYLDDFNSKYNVSLTLLDTDGSVVYMPGKFITEINDALINKQVKYPIKSPNIKIFLQDKITAATGSSSSKKIQEYKVAKEVHFLNDPKTYNLFMNATFQPVDEASKVIFRFMPYVIIFILIISVIGSYIYSRIISNPLLRINKVARQLAGLDFGQKCEVRGEDEIGELAKSLNHLSSNLQDTMNELRNANEKLLEDIEKEREIERKRREFTAAISHELKTPITIIKGQLEGMLSNIGVYKDRDKYLNRSLKVLSEMEQLVRENLEVSKLESSAFKPELRSFELSGLLYKAIENLSPLAIEKDIVVLADIDNDVFTVADEKLMKKVISNIINNAISYSDKGERVFVTLKRCESHMSPEALEHEEGLISIKQSDPSYQHGVPVTGKAYDSYPEKAQAYKLIVENTGAAIDEHQLQDIFKPFYRIEKSRSRNTGGSGLGLYIVKLILEAHKFKYRIYNTKHGVRFEIDF